MTDIDEMRMSAGLPPITKGISMPVETPRTSKLHAELEQTDDTIYDSFGAMSKHACDLERELIAATAALEGMKEQRDEAAKQIREHNHGCLSSCAAHRCGYKNPDGTLIYANRNCPECPQDYLIGEEERYPPIDASREQGRKG